MVWFVYLNEVRNRLVYLVYSVLVSILVIFYYGEEYLIYLSIGYYEVIGNREFIFTDLLEVLWVYLKISIYGGLVVLLFGLFINMLLFSFSVLYYNELLKLLKGVGSLLILGWFFIYYVYNGYMKIVLSSLINLSKIRAVGILKIELEPKVSEYIMLVVKGGSLLVILWLFVCLLVLSIQLGFVDWKILVKYRGVVFVSFLTIIVLLLPPDALLHSIIFICGIMCYESCLVLNYIKEGYLVRLVEW